MSRRKSPHRVTVAKRRLYGSLMWWATCTCRGVSNLPQGWHDKQDAEKSAAEHLEKT